MSAGGPNLPQREGTTGMRVVSTIHGICCNCGSPLDDTRCHRCTDGSIDTFRPSDSIREGYVQQRSNDPKRMMEWRPYHIHNDAGSTTHHNGNRTNDGTLASNADHTQRRVSHTMNSSFSRRRDRSSRDDNVVKAADSNNNSSEKGTTESCSGRNGNDAGVLDGFSKWSHMHSSLAGEASYSGGPSFAPGNASATLNRTVVGHMSSFLIAQHPYAEVTQFPPGNIIATRNSASAVRAPRSQLRRTPSQSLTEEQQWNTITSEEVRPPSLAKKKSDLEAVVDTIVDGVKNLGRRVSRSLSSLFSFETEKHSFYDSTHGDRATAEARYAPLYGPGTNCNNVYLRRQPIGNNGLYTFNTDTPFDVLPQSALYGNNPAINNTSF
ncbi:hypothetical protein STCU_09956 [Strigomonas culicis]|uniref:Uncharacterized protein n=1 Tax=Strigomonas culicis TaxID=28005 RepID=S9V6B9_9TRYP|nr:hypothetical protein STCU_09956 [Strigomonas culicis]|eukprot:EPY18465.1 hypothetical protein STCU_09956 [Strigomonas culicis]